MWNAQLLRIVPVLVLVACAPSSVDFSGSDTPAPPAEGAPGTVHTGTPSSGDSANITDSGTGTLEISSAFRLEKGVRPKNLLFISVDTLRWDRFNALGYGVRTTTPNLDRLLEGGVVLTQNRACTSWTLASFACALSGLSQLDLGYWPGSSGGAILSPFPGEFPGIASLLKAEGFTTSHLTATRFTASGLGVENGYAYLEKIDDSSERLTDRALALLQAQDPDAPWFHHIHYDGPHSPYDPPPEYRHLLDPGACPFPLGTRAETWSLLIDEFGDLSPEQQASCSQQIDLRYDSEIHHDDAQIGRILDWLETGPGEDTLVVFFTDHGEAFNEHKGSTSHGWFHSSSHYDEMVGAMLAFYQPGNLQPARVDKATSLVDLVPSTLALMGIETGRVFTGRVVDLESEVPTFQLGYRKAHTSHTVSTTTDKLHFHGSCVEGRMVPWGPMEYFDLLSDPGETQNLYDPNLPRVQALWAELRPQIVELVQREPDYTPTCSYE